MYDVYNYKLCVYVLRIANVMHSDASSEHILYCISTIRVSYF